jgi:hypothetical protein
MSRWSDAFRAAMQDRYARKVSTGVTGVARKPKEAYNPELNCALSNELDTAGAGALISASLSDFSPVDTSDTNRHQQSAASLTSTATALVSTGVTGVNRKEKGQTAGARQSRIWDDGCSYRQNQQPQVASDAFDPDTDAQNAANAARTLAREVAAEPSHTDAKAPARCRVRQPVLLRAIRRAWPNAVVLPTEPEPAPAAPEHLVQRLATALMIERPWQHITDPVRARAYFEARAMHMLATTAGNPLALVEREERSAAAQAKSDQVERELKATRRG